MCMLVRPLPKPCPPTNPNDKGFNVYSGDVTHPSLTDLISKSIYYWLWSSTRPKSISDGPLAKSSSDLSFGGGLSGKYEKAIHTQHNLRTNRSYKINFMINLLYYHICAVHWRRLKWTRWGVRSYVQCGCNVLAKFWRPVGWSKSLYQ